ncbi:IscS subfamily cysteine desulfurase [Gracilibacillus sp. YIM 98692]|uniref:IscS subfamily cysteine desulfurase n=1 Tax=Gracilibacillus sp. YIM 98692 TaxID=2663532 RepID=UPI0013D78882|nr:IscS subfamily cysteine desulfurase [Gracilibacillus sp. YIM 98692]
MLYFDYAATTPMSTNALNIYTEVAANYFGNPSSLHDIGGEAKQVLEQSRKKIAECLQTDASCITFTSGGTESNLLAIDTLLRASKPMPKKHLITTEMEHSSIYHYMKSLNQKEDIEVTFLRGNGEGVIDINTLKKAIKPNTCIVSIQHVNGETGIMQPVAEIGQLLQEKNIYFHSDAVQSFGKINMKLDQLPVDCMTFSSHKIYGPKGVGALYINSHVPTTPHPVTTNHESGMRPGTVNVPGIAAFAAAVTEVIEKLSSNYSHLTNIKNLFIRRLAEENIPLEPLEFNHQCPSIVGCTNNYIQGDYVMLEYNRFGVGISTGSACTLGHHEIPRSISVLRPNDGKRFVRFSFSHLTTEEDIHQLIDISKQIFQRIKEGQAIHG